MDFIPEIERISKLVDFAPLRNKRVLITGTSGFVGNWMLKGMHAANKQNVNFSGLVLERIGYTHWLKDRAGEYDYVIHLAPTWDAELLRHIQAARPERILFASSGAVYHPHPNDYGKLKLQAENDLLESGMDVRIARMFTFCGPYLRWEHFAVGNFVHSAWKGEPIYIHGDGSTVRSYMYGADLAIWLWNILLHGEPGGIYNVGSEQRITIAELAEKVRSIVNPEANIITRNAISEERAPVYLPDTSKTRADLGVSETYTLDEQITRYAEWMYDQVN